MGGDGQSRLGYLDRSKNVEVLGACDRAGKNRRRRRRSTREYKGRTDSNSSIGPNEAVCLATLLLL